MMGERTVMQEELFYGFSLEWHVQDDHLLRAVDRLVDFSDIRQHPAPFYSPIGLVLSARRLIGSVRRSAFRRPALRLAWARFRSYSPAPGVAAGSVCRTGGQDCPALA